MKSHQVGLATDAELPHPTYLHLLALFEIRCFHRRYLVKEVLAELQLRDSLEYDCECFHSCWRGGGLFEYTYYLS